MEYVNCVVEQQLIIYISILNQTYGSEELA